ncbi:MAG: hypothetical protein ACF8XB_25735 [Planctomycetota bacterium JB042]
MTCCSNRLIPALIASAFLTGELLGQGSPSIEVGHVDHEVESIVTRYDSKCVTSTQIGQKLKVRVNGNVGEWVYVLVDARLKTPSGSPSSEYVALTTTYPFLAPATPTTLDPLIYGSQPDLVVHEQNLFQPAIDAVHLPSPVLPPDPASIRAYFQPIVADQTGPATRIFRIDPKTWVHDSADEQLEWWSYCSWYRDPSPVMPENLDIMSAEGVFQSALLLKGGTAAQTFFETQGEYRRAIAVGLELAIQAVVYASTSNQPSQYTPANEVNVAGLEGVGTSAASLQLTEPVVINIRVNDGSSGAGLLPAPLYVFLTGAKASVHMLKCQHKDVYVSLRADSTDVITVKKLKFDGAGKGYFWPSPSMGSSGSFLSMIDPDGVTTLDPTEYRYLLDPFGS